MLALILLISASFVAAGEAPVAEAARKADWAAVDNLIKQKADVNATVPDGSTALHFTARADEVAIAELLIKAGARVEVANRYGATPLDIAAQNGSASMIQKLLAAGANPNSVNPAGETVLMSAARAGNPEALKVLLDVGAEINAKVTTSGLTALMAAVLENRPAAVATLLQRGAEVNGRTRRGPEPVQRTGVDGRSHGDGITRQRVPNPYTGEVTALIYAARDGRLDSVKILLAGDADVNQTDANRTSPLVVAILNNYLDVAHYLLDKGADPNLADGYGRSPLFATVELRNVELDSPKRPDEGLDRAAALLLIQRLLDLGADPNARARSNVPVRAVGAMENLFWVDMAGQTSFIRAATSGDMTTMRLLLKYGADPNLVTFDGTSALMAAAGVNWVEGVNYNESEEAMIEALKLCVELGADVNKSNTIEGFTALHGAANKGGDGIIEYLVSQGADLTLKDRIGRTALTWAEGVFIGARTQTRKPKTIELIERLLAASR